MIEYGDIMFVYIIVMVINTRMLKHMVKYG